MTKSDTEVSAAHRPPDGQKSFAVELLQFFHYVPQRIPRCWTREELLTWELWIEQAETARSAKTISGSSPLPTDLVAARSAFETAWRQASLPSREAT